MAAAIRLSDYFGILDLFAETDCICWQHLWLACPAVDFNFNFVSCRCVVNFSGTEIARATFLVLLFLLGSEFALAPKYNIGQKVVALATTAIKTATVVMFLRNIDLVLEDYFFEFSYLVLRRAAIVAAAWLLVVVVLQPTVAVSEIHQPSADDSDAELQEAEEEKFLPDPPAKEWKITQGVLLALSSVYYISTTMTGPFFEELLFRGIVLTSLNASLSGNAPLLLSAALFALYRRGWGIRLKVSYFLGGILLGLGYMASEGNLLLPILAHTLHKAMAFVFAAFVDRAIDPSKAMEYENGGI